MHLGSNFITDGHVAIVYTVQVNKSTHGLETLPNNVIVHFRSRTDHRVLSTVCALHQQ